MFEEDIGERAPLTNQFVDKVTLELLMNKNHYNRYISQNDPKKHKEYLEHLEKIGKYRSAIINMTTDFLDNPNHMVTTEISEAYDYYVKTLIRHFEYKKLENQDEDESLFGDMENNTNEDESENISKSFWGKNKVVKKQADIFNYTMNYIPRINENPDL